MNLPVVFDVHVLVRAVVEGNSTFTHFPSPPPVHGQAAAECVGIVNDAEEFALLLSPHILTNVARVLGDRTRGYGWPEDQVEEYLRVLVKIAEASGGMVLSPAVPVADCTADYEDNRILELALAGNAALIISADQHLLELSPWRGIPVIEPHEFVGRVDAMRRARRR